jgi:hypothetical protein
MGHYTEDIVRNAEKINRLKVRIDEAFKHRDTNDHKRREWEAACADFHAQYDALTFPGGLSGAYERIVSGDAQSVEAALCFLECRPYFFRSGYMFKDILRKVKHAPLKGDQYVRFEAVLKAYDEYKQSKRSGQL